MKFDGVVIRIDGDLYLFICNIDKNEIRDGVNISDNECYSKLVNNKLMVVNVKIKDGTKDIEDIDLDEFIYGTKYGKFDTFIHIHDIVMYSIKNEDVKNEKNTLIKLIKNGELKDLAISCINDSKRLISESLVSTISSDVVMNTKNKNKNDN